jgi:uncharacterized cofD-like protein
MFDTGGSSGELRDRFGILPPGDILKCVLALSKHESYARQMLLRRIVSKEFPGHTGGNVLLLGLQNVYGSHAEAVKALGQLLSIRGRVIPVTNEDSCLCASYCDGSIHKGETCVDVGIHEGKIIGNLFLQPSVSANEDAILAIEEADLICIGPGSFYTSVLPNFLPSGIKKAMQNSKAKTLFIANLLTEGKGMRGINLEDCIKIVEFYTGRHIDFIIANSKWPSLEGSLYERYALENKYPIQPSASSMNTRIVFADLWQDDTYARHDSSRLAHLVGALANNQLA